MKEENVIILDYLPNGYPDRRRAEPIAQSIGTKFFTLLELVTKDDVNLTIGEKVYIGDGKRDKIKFIKGQIEYKNLTNLSQNSIEDNVEKIVKENEKMFVNFFNKGTLITPRMHQFQLLPGVGKKHLQGILEQRRKNLFESFTDISSRVKLFPDPMKSIIKKIIGEIKGEEKYNLFTHK